jgi:hypothetical protein
VAKLGGGAPLCQNFLCDGVGRNPAGLALMQCRLRVTPFFPGGRRGNPLFTVLYVPRGGQKTKDATVAGHHCFVTSSLLSFVFFLDMFLVLLQHFLNFKEFGKVKWAVFYGSTVARISVGRSRV